MNSVVVVEHWHLVAQVLGSNPLMFTILMKRHHISIIAVIEASKDNAKYMYITSSPKVGHVNTSCLVCRFL